MAKQRRGDASEEATKQVRVFEDLGEMISMIVRVEGGTTANLLDPMLRPQITTRYGRHKEAIDRILAAERELQRVENEAKRQAEELQSRKKRQG